MAKINLRGTYIIDQRLTSIQLTLCNRLNTGEEGFSYNCDLKELKRLFELYKEKIWDAHITWPGRKIWLVVKKNSNVYSPGPNGRWFMDKIYFWDKGTI